MPLSRHALTSVFQPTEKVLVAVSGGLDSIVLLHLLATSGIRVGVAHVNFGLRGEESDADEAFVLNLAQQYNVPFFCNRFQTKGHASEKGISVQMAARALRYKWFEELRQQENFEVIATAHHLNDNLETALLNFVRGTGPAGLAGMKIRTGNLVRPLLHFTREEIRNYAHTHNLTWREDSSNSSDAYKRNFLRHQVIPLLQQLNPNLLHTFLETSQRLADADELVKLAAQNAQAREGKPGFWRINKSNLPESGTALVLHEVLRPFNFTYRQAAEVCAALRNQPGKWFFSPTHKLLLDREELIISELVAAANPVEIAVSEELNPVGTGNYVFWFSKFPADGYHLQADLETAALDFEKLQFPLLIRNWKQGDKFRPLGTKGSKKVSDLLIDRKVPLSEKDQVLVVESGNEIAWVIGLQLSDSFKITPKTSQVLEIKCRPC